MKRLLRCLVVLMSLLICLPGYTALCDSAVTLPSDLTSVEAEAFRGNGALVTVNLSDGCESIGSRAFAGCTALKNVYMPRNISSIADDAFENSANVVIWCYANTYAHNFAKDNNITFRFRDEYKIAIMTGSNAQSSEEYAAAQKLVSLSGGKVIYDMYPDDFVNKSDETIAKIEAFADDPLVKAIIVVQAVNGTTEAFSNIRAERSDILLIAGVPAEDPYGIAAVADVVLSIDETEAGGQAGSLAVKWGCDVLVLYSFPRHMKYESISAKRDRMQVIAEEGGVSFVYRECKDPVSGMTDAVKFIEDDLPVVMNAYPGKKVCFYCTNCGLQAPLQKAVLAQPNAYYSLPCCPSPFHGFTDAFNLSGSYSDAPGMLKKLAEYLDEHGAAGRFSTWAVPVNMAMIDGAFTYSEKWALGALNGKLDIDSLRKSIADAAGSEVSFAQYGSLSNYQLITLAPVDFADYK